jgi:hypothetical protein
MQMLTTTGLVDRTEYGEAKSVLRAAAFTYVAGLAREAGVSFHQADGELKEEPHTPQPPLPW